VNTSTLQPLAVDAKALAGLLGVCERTVRSMDSSGRLPKPLRLNDRSVRWVVAEVQDWLRAGAPDRKTWEVLKESA
jgi:predicted DNA-binding transcriptional regulator AlpA